MTTQKETIKNETKAPKAPRAPRTKKVVAAPVIAEGIQEVVAEQLATVIPDAVIAAPNIVAGSIAPMAMMDCTVCKQSKEKKTFVVQSKKAGSDTPEEGVMCKDCHEDLVEAQTKNGGTPGRYKNLMDSRHWDKNADWLARTIKREAGRTETRLRCIGAPGEPCGIYHGQYLKGKVQFITTREFLKNSIDLAKKDLEAIPLPKGACELHKEVFKQEVRASNPGVQIIFIRGLEAFDLIDSINTWRKNEKARIEVAREARRLADQETYRLQLQADDKFYVNPVTQNVRPASKKQETRFAPSGNTHFGKLENTEEGRRR